MTSYEENIQENKTVKERTFKIRLSDADVERIFQKSGSVDLTPEQLIENFIGDLVYGTYTNGSDERMYANEWFDRCGFSFGGKTFLAALIEQESVEDFLKYWKTYTNAKNYVEELMRDPQTEKEDILWESEEERYQKERLQEFFDDFQEYEHGTIEEEVKKAEDWQNRLISVRDGISRPNHRRRKIMTRLDLERRYEEQNLNDYKLHNLKQLQEIHGVDINNIPGYQNLPDEQRKIFNEAIINFYNAWGLDRRKTLIPKSVNYVYEVNYFKKLNITDDFYTDIGQNIYVLNSDGSIERRLHKYVFEKDVSFKTCERDTKVYLRFELKGEWYHIISATEWY